MNVDRVLDFDRTQRCAEAVKAGNRCAHRSRSAYTPAPSVASSTRTSAVQNRLYAEQNLVRAVRVTADVLIFLVVDPAAVNVLTNLVKRILIGLCQLFALKVVQRVVTGRFCGDVGIAVLIQLQRHANWTRCACRLR